MKPRGPGRQREADRSRVIRLRGNCVRHHRCPGSAGGFPDDVGFPASGNIGHGRGDRALSSSFVPSGKPAGGIGQPVRRPGRVLPSCPVNVRWLSPTASAPELAVRQDGGAPSVRPVLGTTLWLTGGPGRPRRSAAGPDRHRRDTPRPRPPLCRSWPATVSSGSASLISRLTAVSGLTGARVAARRTRIEAPIMRLLTLDRGLDSGSSGRWCWSPGTPRCRAGRQARHGRQQLSRAGCRMVAIG